MPYELLDAIERAAIRDKLVPVEVFQQMQPRFPQYARDNWASGSNDSFASGAVINGRAA